jgi:hypothetical protein
MGLFSKIVDKIFHHDQASASASRGSSSGAAAGGAASGRGGAPAPPGRAAPVDVEAVLVSMAEIEGGGGNWRTSIVDLLKLAEARLQFGGAQGPGR